MLFPRTVSAIKSVDMIAIAKLFGLLKFVVLDFV